MGLGVFAKVYKVWFRLLEAYLEASCNVSTGLALMRLWGFVRD